MNYPPPRDVRLRHFICAALFVLVCAVGATAAAPEPWADKGLKVVDGLVVWLDAAAENAARTHGQLPTLSDGDPLATWHDASGNHRDVLQQTPQQQPKLRVDGQRAFVCFNGESTSLALESAAAAFNDLTMFLVTAPYANDGGFRGFLALNRLDANDYTSGLTVDQSFALSDQFDALNVEGAGFTGAQNLKLDRTPLLVLNRLCVTSTVEPAGTVLFVNDQRAGKRDRSASKIGMDRLTVGARFYGNGEPPRTQSFLHGEIAEVLIYDRVLDEQQRSDVDHYLKTKYGDKLTVPSPLETAGNKPLVRVANPPRVQMFVPGFSIKDLPVDLPNINNVLYRRDGTLVALAYNGNIYLLSDSDGDGLEDRAKLFWENRGNVRAPIGMDLTPEGYPRGRGVFFASKDRCLLIADTDGDDVADSEIVVANGWKETGHGVDALGVVYDPRNGSVLFGLGCQDYTNAYVVGPDGKAGYDLGSERGTIMRVAKDFASREIVATGIRFPVAIRFNRHGDLFCTDQEGATWLPNGNPSDELLHVERGRHYGFPPRHPRHLPNVIDEPSVFDYAPQHQSTCGLNFNESVAGGPTFGPAWWQSDAIVTGYSRGKLYRTKLVKTPAGYVARNQPVAALSMLPADACVSPQGDLVVATHSGGPDWGSGPTGKGKLFKIVHARPTAPQPVLVWPASPHELWIAFDRPLSPDDLRALSSGASIDFGPYVAAGDRFESLRPGYAVVAQQARTGRFDLPALGVQVTADRRNLIVSTARHSSAVNYAIALPGIAAATTSAEKGRELAQESAIDLSYDLTGVEAIWQPSPAGVEWRGWLPHLDLAVARELTTASALHDDLWQRCRQSGTFVLRTQLNTRDMLRPAVQPGATLDYEWPAEQVTLVCTSAAPLEASLDGRVIRATTDDAGQFSLRIPFPPAGATATHQLELRLPHGDKDAEPTLSVSYFTNEDERSRALPVSRLLLPWATLDKAREVVIDNSDLPELRGGNWVRGRKLFFSEEAACAKCHKVRGEGGAIGPDLSNLVQRDYASVLRDISEPSFAINPDFVSQVVSLNDGRIVTGSVRTRGDTLIIGGQDGRETIVSRGDVEDLQPSATSIMPQGLPAKLGPEKMRDLLTFLLVSGPHMPDYGKATPPPARSLAEVTAALAGAPADAASPRPLHVALIAGPKDHGPGEHDYPAWLKSWQRLLGLAEEMRVTKAEEWPTAEQLATADVLVFYQHGSWTPERAKDIDAFLARGGGLVYIHFAVDGGADAPGFARRIGLAWQGGPARFRHGDLDISLRPGADHPIARNFDKLHLVDESYWNLVGNPASINLLGTGVEEGHEKPLFWTLTPGKGRVFVSIPGHFSWTFDDPLFRLLLLRGIAWSASESVDRFNDLVFAGARIETSSEAPAAAPARDAP